MTNDQQGRRVLHGPSIETLRELIQYDELTGEMFWKKRTAKHFTSSKSRSAEHMANNWNALNAGAKALSSAKGSGYLHGTIYNKKYLAHRVAFAIYTGRWPTGQIDHINGNRSDNRAINLREVTSQENSRNAAMPFDNKTGQIGVCWNKNEKKWKARIGVGGKDISLGTFADFEDAKNARKDAEKRFGFSSTHGRSQ
jgi:phosphopantetheinyl transferase (holo-ACP synthase)